MSGSWKAFFYGALDPGATITIDKLAGSFAVQGFSARLLGYHAWSLTLPQVVEGVIAVLAMYRIGRRWISPATGLLAAGLFGLTPIVASMFAHPMEDGLLIMCLVLAADSLQRAVLEARLASLVLAGFWVGIGFQAKMLQAWMILPALAITYLIAAPTSLRRRLTQLTVAGVVMLAVSLSWVALYTLTPAHDRPYVDGSTNNSAIASVFGYNGLDRFGIHVPGAVQSAFGGGGGSQRPTFQGTPAGVAGAPTGGPAGVPNFSLYRQGGGSGWTKLFSHRYASQIGWLYPLAAFSLLFGLLYRRRGPRTDGLRTGYLLWGLWLITVALVFSKIMIPHTAYLSALAPALAALSAAGIVHAWRAYQDGSARWMFPIMVLIELVWAGYLSAQFPDFLPWLPWVAGITGGLALLALGLGAVTRRGNAMTAMTVAVAAMLLIPGVWAASVLDSKYSGSAFDASAGPVSQQGPGGVGGNRPAGAGRTLFAGPGLTAVATLTTAQQQIYRYLSAHRAGAQFLAATDSWNTASPYILATGQKLLPMGGFSGSVPQPTLTTVQSLVRQGQLRFFLLSSGMGGFSIGATGTGGSVTAIKAWVRATCSQLPATVYGGTDADAGTAVPAGPFGAGDPTIYSCATA